MPRRTVKLLHVEDDASQRLLVARFLQSLEGWSFAIIAVETEDSAISEFGRGGFECVILDYQLLQGNGLSCLSRLRQMDPVVPIIAVSGVATPELASELLQAGADDYLSKQELRKDSLSKSVCQALARADAWKQRAPGGGDSMLFAGLESMFQEMCTTVAALGPNLLERMDALEDRARQAGLTPQRLQRLFEKTCKDMDARLNGGRPFARQLLRPLLLEMVLRLFGNVPADNDSPTREP